MTLAESLAPLDRAVRVRLDERPTDTSHIICKLTGNQDALEAAVLAESEATSGPGRGRPS